MAKKIKTYKKISASKVAVMKLRNRRGFAALCFGNLTEGRTPALAVARMTKALKRMGFVLTGTPPRPR